MPHALQLSVIITAHSEGILLHRTLASVRRAIDELPANTCEIIVHVDNPTEAMKNYLDTQQEKSLHGVFVYINSFGDLGSSRNFAVTKAHGKYIATIDADDIMSKRWLKDAVEALNKCSEPTIAHSQFTVEFEGVDAFVIKHGEIDVDTDTLLSVFSNRWNSVIVAPRDIMLKNPYTPNSPGYGYEDWNFNCRMIAQGIHNILIPNTVIFVRRKLANSEWARQIQSMAVLRANPLLSFDHIRTIKDPFSLYRETSEAPIYSSSRLKALIKRHPSTHKIARAIKRTISHPRKNYESGAQIIPSWMEGEWRELHSIDKQLFPRKELLTSIPTYDTISFDHKLTGSLYKALIDQTHYNGYDYVIFVPWLTHGGADKYTIEYANSYAKKTGKHVLIIATLDSESPWKSKLSSTVDIIEFGRITRDAKPEIKHRLLEHIIENASPSRIHIINSELGYDFVRLHDTYLRASGKKIIVTAFSQSIDPQTGRVYGYSHTHVPFVYEQASLITSDNQAVIDMWQNEYGFDPKKMAVHRQSLPFAPQVKKDFSAHKPFSILWAGRVAPEKLPELIPTIASSLGDEITIDIYGHADETYTSLLNNLPSNVTYRGPYSGFSSIDVSRYDCILYTSLFDGMPNIILESAQSGLPIIASSVGGIPEFIVDATAGILVTDIQNPLSYVDAIRTLMASSDLRENLANAAYHKITTDFSENQCDKNITDVINL